MKWKKNENFFHNFWPISFFPFHYFFTRSFMCGFTHIHHILLLLTLLHTQTNTTIAAHVASRTINHTAIGIVIHYYSLYIVYFIIFSFQTFSSTLFIHFNVVIFSRTFRFIIIVSCFFFYQQFTYSIVLSFWYFVRILLEKK